MKLTRKTFGILSNGSKVRLYVLKAGDLKLCLSSFGATWTSLFVPSRNNIQDDILLGYSGFDGFLNNSPYFGVTIGRVANRIKDGNFSIAGKSYQIGRNDGNNALHGGFKSFDKMQWKSEAYENSEGVYVRFDLESPDGDCGFPGTLKTSVVYGITKNNELVAVYEAQADAPTPVNLTNHAYFNFAGEGKGNILSHELSLNSSSYLENDSQLLPTGKLLPVKNSAFDFREMKAIGKDLGSKLDGYDHCFIVDGDPGKLRACADVYEPGSGRTMSVFTTQPGVQFYTGNMLKEQNGKAGSIYKKHSGFCLETQHFPDSPNHSDFPSCLIGPGKNYKEKTVFTFEVK